MYICDALRDLVPFVEFKKRGVFRQILTPITANVNITLKISQIFIFFEFRSVYKGPPVA